MILTVCVTIFCRYYYSHDYKLDAIFFCYISGVLTDHMFENLHGFYSYNFTMANELNDYSFQECSIITWSTKRSEVIFRDLLKSVAKTDSQIISWREVRKHKRNNTIQKPFPFKLQEY